MLSAMLLSIAAAGPAVHGNAPSPEDRSGLVRVYIKDHASKPAVASAHLFIPSFSRQTGLACSACHTSFPQLNAFGRQFKLNGYTLTGLPVIVAGDSGKRQLLKLGQVPPVSVMLQTSVSQVNAAPAGTQNGSFEFPQQLSLFFSGEITPKIGTFLQLTYAGDDGAIGIDNAEVRYADHTTLHAKPLMYGLTLNNNPTVQDVWNTVPAWRFPFASSSVAPTPAAAPLLEGALSQQVAGLGAFAVWNNTVYAEFSGYRSAVQGGAHPADSSSTNTISGIAPYWRAWVQHTWNGQTIMLGTFGMAAHLLPLGVTGTVNRYTDFALDGQYERQIGTSDFSLHGSWLRENQHLAASFEAGAVANPTNTVKTLRFDAGLITASRVGFTFGYFGVSGTSDLLLYGAAPVQGSAAGSPDSRGVLAEVSVMPWLNTRFSVQYVAYDKFNGAKLDYDGAGRKASDNNVLYFLTWLVF